MLSVFISSRKARVTGARRECRRGRDLREVEAL